MIGKIVDYGARFVPTPLAFEAVGLGDPNVLVVGILCQREAKALVGIGVTLVLYVIVDDVEQVVRLEIFVERYLAQALAATTTTTSIS
ncbi:MAG: hypothetical protein ACOCM7_05120, partial [Bacteroidales bacterium]